MARDPRRHRFLKRLLYAVLGLVAVLLLVAAAFVGVLLHDPSALTSQIQQQVLPSLSQQLGRQVKVADVRIAIFPPAADLKDVTVAGREGEPPLAQVGNVRASLRLWPLLKSLGREVQLDAVELQKPVINLVRARDSSWSTQGVKMESDESRQVLIEELAVRDGELHVIDRSAGGPATAVALRDIDVDAEGLGAAEATSVALKAALAGQVQNVDARFDLSPGQKVEGRFDVKPLDLRRLQGVLPAGLEAAVTGGRLELSGKVATAQDGAMEVRGEVGAPSLDLRGQRASGRFSYAARIPKGAAGQATVSLSGIRVNGPGVDLGGKASVSPARKSVRFELAGPLLDLDTLLAALPSSAEEPKAAEGPPLPEPMRRQLGSVTVSGKVRVEKMVVKKLVSEHVELDASLSRGVLVVSRANGAFYGGKLDLAGTRLDLTRRSPRWELDADLRGMDLGQAMQLVSGANPLLGRFTGKLNLNGDGDVWQQLRTSLTGKGSFTFDQGKLTTASLEQALAAPLTDAFRVAGKLSQMARGGSGNVLPPAAGTELRDLTGSFTLEDGLLRFSRPVTVRSSFGEMTVGGAIGLDQRLDLTGTARLTPEFVKRITGMAPKEALDAPLKIGGTLAAPQISVDGEALAGAVAGQVAPKLPTPDDLLDKGLKGLFPGP